MQSEIIGKMNRILLFVVLCAAACFSTGCIACMFSSMKILEDREFSVYPRIGCPLEAYLLGDTLYVKYPTSIYTDRWTWFSVGLLHWGWGGRTGVNWYANSNETVWIKNRRTDPERDLGKGGALLCNLEYDAKDQHPEEKLRNARKIPLDYVRPVYLYGSDYICEDYRLAGEKPVFKYDLGPVIPQTIYYSENGFWWTTLAVLDGILIDFPVSLVMTLTGSFWYIPLTYL